MLGHEGLELPLELPPLIRKDLSGGPIAAEHSLQKRPSCILRGLGGEKDELHPFGEVLNANQHVRVC